MGILTIVLAYSAYVVLLFVISTSSINRHHSDKVILDKFFKYVKKGRKRVAMLLDHLLSFAVLQLLYPLIAVFSTNIPLIYSFMGWFAISFAIFYVYALSRDVVKAHRHNGIAIGYEYPHPVDNAAIKTETHTVGNVTMGGSKGVYDLQIKSEPNPHIMVIGATGMGKSNLITTLLARAYLKFKIPFLIIDWSGAYKNIDVNVWTVPTNLRVNPFLLRGKSIERRAGIASELLQIALGLTDMQTQKVRETLDVLYHEGHEPSIQMLHNRLTDEIATQRYKETKLQLTYITNKLRQAYEIFGSEPKEFWDNYDKTCNIVSLHGLTDMEKKLVTHTIMQRITEEFKGEQGTKLYIALDDAYQALLSYYGKETNITKIVREGRKYGFGLVIATQLLQDMPEAIPANTAVKFILGYHESNTLQRLYSMLKLSDLEKAILFRIPVGHALLFDQNAIQNGKPNPAYIEVDVVSVSSGKVTSDIAVGDNPTAIELSPDGSRAYVVNSGHGLLNGSISVISTASQKVVGTVVVGPNPTSIALSASGTVGYVTNAGTLSAGGTLSLINTATDLVTRTISVGANPTDVVLNANASLAYVTVAGNTLLSGSVDVVNLARGTVGNIIRVGTDPTSIAISSNGRAAYVVNSGSGTVSVLNTSSNSTIASVTVGADPTGIGIGVGNIIYVTNSGGALATGSGTISEINAVNNMVVGTISLGSGSAPFGISISSNTALVTESGTGMVAQVGLATNTVSSTISIPSEVSAEIASPSGSTIYVVSADSGTVSAVNTLSGTVIGSVGLGDDPTSIALSANGGLAYLTDSGTGIVSVINTTNLGLVANISVGASSGADAVAVGENGGLILVADGNAGTVSVINSGSNQVASVVSVGVDPVQISVSSDGNTAYVADAGSNQVSIINLQTDSVAATVNVGSNPTSISISPSGGTAYVADTGSNQVSVINLSNDAVVATISVGSAPTSVAVSPSGGSVYVADSGGSGSVVTINAQSDVVSSTVNSGSASVGVLLT